MAENTSIEAAPMNDLERNRFRITIQEQQNLFAANPNPLMLEMMIRDSSHVSPLRQMIVLSERTPETALHHNLWFLRPPDSQIEQHAFHEYYEYCVGETRRLYPDEPPYSITIFTERYKDALKAEPIIAKISGSREIPADSSEEQLLQRQIAFHLIHQDGIYVYTLPYSIPSMNKEDFPIPEDGLEALPYRSCSAEKLFYRRYVTDTVKYFRSPEGWEGLEGEMQV
jgi:hypothetical protein